MSWTHVTNKVVFMFDVCPVNCKPGMYDTARIRDCTAIIYLIGFWFEFGNGKGVSNGKQQFAKGFRSQVIPNMACRMKPGADILQARSKFGVTVNMQYQVQQKKAGPSPTKHVAPCLAEHAGRGLLQGVWSGDEIAASVARICWKCNCLLSQLVKKNKSANHCYHDILLLYIVAVTFYLFLRFLSKLDACLIAEKDFTT